MFRISQMLKLLKEIIKIDGRAANAVVNNEKSNKGKTKTQGIYLSLSLRRTLKILGWRQLSPNFKEMIKLNWKCVIKNMKTTMALSYMRHIRLICKINCLNIYTLSRVYFVAQILPLPHQYSQKIVCIT